MEFDNRIKDILSKIKAPFMAYKPEKTTKNHKEKLNESSSFECNICLEPAKNAVVSICGHLFCWPCLYTWFQTKPYPTVCPVCKELLSSNDVIPLYGRSSSNEKSESFNFANKKLPPRPNAQRKRTTTNESRNTNSNFFPSFTSFFGIPDGYLNNGFQISFGIGAFPFGLFSTFFNLGGNFNTPDSNNNHQTRSNLIIGEREQAIDRFLSSIFIFVALFFVFWLFIA